jgi:diadenosine tetraphosphate (Ap4A) HIT family hydrolase
MPQSFDLDPRLAADCHRLGQLGDAELLLMDNAHFPWLILVPHCTQSEWYELDLAQQQALLTSINALSDFIKQQFPSDKLNIASIGNIVSQLHIHIIGRHHDDPCWPGVVWGTLHRIPYIASHVQLINTALIEHLGNSFIAYSNQV